MRNAIRLTERDLTRLVKRIINETIKLDLGCSPSQFQNYAANPITNATVDGENVTFTFKDNSRCTTNVINDDTAAPVKPVGPATPVRPAQ